MSRRAYNCPEDRASIAALEHRLARMEANSSENPSYDWHRFRRLPAGVYDAYGKPRGGRFAEIRGGSPARVVHAREKVRNPATLSAKQKKALKKGQWAIKHASASTRRKWALKAAKTRCQKKLALLAATPMSSPYPYSYSVPPPHALEESMKSYEMEHNPELLIVGNPSKRRRLRLRVRHKRRSRKGGPRRIKHGKKLYYYIQLISKFGKAKARKIWGRKCRKSCGVSKRRRSHGRKSLSAPKGSWKALVKRYGVMGAVRHRRGRRSRR